MNSLEFNASVLDHGFFARQGNSLGVWVHLFAMLEVTPTGGPSPTNTPSTNFGLWSGGQALPSGVSFSLAENGSLGLYVTVPSSSNFTLRVALSLVDPGGARENLFFEQWRNGTGWLSLEAARANVEAVWEEALGSIKVEEALDSGGGGGAGNEEPPFCPPPLFDPNYTALLPGYFSNNESGGGGNPPAAPWLLRHGLPQNSSGHDIAEYIWGLSCFHPPPLTSWLPVLYTSLYHSLCAPTTASDASGRYVGLDGSTRLSEGGDPYFSDLSLWDIHRTQVPLLSLLYPAQAYSLLRSLLAMAGTRGGVLPRWPFANVETAIMCGDHGLVVLADVLLKLGGGGGQGEFITAADLWSVANATLSARNALNPSWETQGWIPVEEGHSYCRGATLTLEFGFDDGVGATLASMAGDEAGAAVLKNRSRAYTHLWSNTSGALCPRQAAGELNCSTQALSLPFPFNHFWTEADGLQMSWFVPGDPGGLAGLYASSSSTGYLATFNSLIARAAQWPLGNFMPNQGLWYGNEPSLLIPWQALWDPPLGAARVQKVTRDLLSQYYTQRFDGIPGNDDYGTMSAGCVFTLLGLYPLAGTDLYLLGSPTFRNVTLRVGQVNVRVLSHGNDKNSTAFIYVERVTLNSIALPAPFLHHRDFALKDSLIEFFMTDAPSPWNYTF